MAASKIIVIGGGAAGLLAAGHAALAGASVTLFEKMKRPGRKICIAGKGRCNITNIKSKEEFIQNFPETGDFLDHAFSSFFRDDILEILEQQRLGFVSERGGRIFPATGKASDVRDALVAFAEGAGVRIIPSSTAEEIMVADKKVTGVIVNGNTVFADKVILTTGGASYPNTGSSGDGYDFAKRLGHTIVPIRPALVAVRPKGNLTKNIKELTLKNIKVRLYLDGEEASAALGEIAFTERGIGGAVVLTMSRTIVDALKDQKGVELSLDLKPGLRNAKLRTRIQRDMQQRKHEPIRSILRGLLPQDMVFVCLTALNWSPRRLGKDIKEHEQEELRTWLKDFRLRITDHGPFEEAIITAGGVSVDEINSETMESKLVNGLYMAGELIDIQGNTGGFNLQAAFSTGYLAGKSAAIS